MPEQRPRWTEAQQAAISATEAGVLVSAAAGSGKTSVLAERCVHLVCDAKPRCAVNQLLVVTFTEAAAAEMKSRIEQALRQRLASAGDDAHLRRQFALIEQAQVSTLHSFCHRVIQQNFQRLGLDPGFRVLDADEAKLMRMDIARQLFEDRYEQDEGGAFQRFIDAYGQGDDQRLMDQVVRLHEVLCSLVEPERWMEQAVGRIEEAADRPMEKSALGREFLALVRGKLESLIAESGAALTALGAMTGFDSYAKYVGGLRTTLDEWKAALDARGCDALADAVKAFNPPRLPIIRGGPAGKETAQGLVEAVREPMKKGFLAKTLRFSSRDWRDGLSIVLPHARILLDLVGEFGRRYQAAKTPLHAVDFADLERLTLDLLRDEAVAATYRRIFRHVLVDEYQDINEVQDAILGLLTAGREDGSAPSFFCVGDVKQSIYRFRLAEPMRFLQRQQGFRDAPAARVIDLQANFRSRAALLDVVNFVFERLMTRSAAEIEYDQTHRLHAGADYPLSDDPRCFTGAPVDLHVLPGGRIAQPEAEDGASAEEDDQQDLERNEREAMLVAEQIHLLMGNAGLPRRMVFEKSAAGLSPRPIDYRDIVILLRSTKFQSDQYASILRRRGIPVYNESGRGYFDSMEVLDVISLLRVLDNPRQDIPLAAVLRSPIGNLPNPEDSLARIRLAYPNGDPPVPFHDAASRYAAEQQDELAAKLRDFFAQVSEWRELARRRPVAELLSHIYDQSGYLAFCSGLESGPQRCANLIDLYDRARQFGAFAHQGLARFLQFLEGLARETEQAQATELSAAENVVRIMSVHAAKGLEFPVVFLPNLGKRINLESCSGDILADRQAFLGLTVVDEARRVKYDSLARKLVERRIHDQSLAEELRILYVAMTRAREHLVLIGTTRGGAAESAEAWRQRWSGHSGPLPPDEVLSAHTMLDWLGPVAAAITPAIEIRVHSAEEVAAWQVDPNRRPRLNDHQKKLAALEPLSPAPAMHALAEQIKAELQSRYAFEPFTTVAASQSVTALTKHGAPAAADHDGEPALPKFVRPLPLPRFLSADATLSAPDRGTAVHLALEHLDFARPATREDLIEQIGSMLVAKRIAPEQTMAVDVDTLMWFLESPLGEQIRRAGGSVLRELAFNYAMPAPGAPASVCPLDQVMLRGRIDLLVPDGHGWMIVDYKTDRVSGAALDARAELYGGQMRLYREAVAKITDRPVHRAQLVFLWAREIRLCS